MTEIKDENEQKTIKCMKCLKVYIVDEFKSLVENCNDLKKTCQTCRKQTYEYYKRSNPEKIKEVIDYNKEYTDYLRCRNCNRKTTGKSDFKSQKSDIITKTCITCRKSVLKSVKKNNSLKPKKLTLKDKCKAYEKLLNDNNITYII